MAEFSLLLHQDNTKISIPSDCEEFTIGRLPECDWCLPFAGISRCHARLRKSPLGAWRIEDMGSKNGTRLNERPVTASQVVRDGDTIWLGDISLQAILSASQPDLPPVTTPLPSRTTILHNVKELQQQWIQASSGQGETSNKDTTIDRLKELVEIGKHLSAAASIEDIFDRVQEVVFRYITSIDRLALLVDVEDCGELQLLNAAARDSAQQPTLIRNGSWISQSICQKVFTEQVAIQTADAQLDERFEGQQSILLKNIKSAIAVPIWDEDKVVGVLYADANHSANDWAEEGAEDLSFFSALANLTAANVQRWLLAQKLRSEETLRQRLERYHSPAVVQQLIALGAIADGRLPPAESEISILFADIVGFTALSERLTPAKIAQLLNGFFEEMLQEVFTFGGTLDKYIGDCIMTFFGAPEPQRDRADRAVGAAMGMLKRLERLNASGQLGETLQLRIAINSGKAVIGDVGSSQRVDYTALGATINLAARMEAICPPGECVISEATYQLLTQKNNFQEMGEYRFKGIERPIKIYCTQQ
ncbi:adenylate/guanylate cyclase domain-containing protein [Lusitaniella coriacea]|uniref:adenylate/guanylate cyclase domain-containing protein n=1 Tax=Lusitaniella coriacea TaxID=1983105 RepID=UPI003CF074C6